MELQPAPQPDRWQRLEELFHDALEMDPAERPAFLSQACQGDPEMRKEVESLLDSADKALTSLRAPVERTAAQIAGGDEPSPGMRIGPYRLRSLLGEGGMGKVYLAERDDDQFRQRVAIKLTHAWPGYRSAMLTRFRTERQILANLVHPNIARLLDGGMTGDGSPYLVMEYVDGKPIDKYCAEHNLSIKQRLELFRDVCSAVEYAHRNLIIHRDIKPANILVTTEGVPKLLDFGIAKLLDTGDLGGANPNASPLTRSSEHMMTPEYASPEQARGEPVTTATDVYGLGALLYELLSGQRPFTFTTKNTFEVARIICEVDPKPPSEARMANPAFAAASADDRKLDPDLDTIVLMAMRKEPARRYGSAAQLSTDIRAFLDGYPLVARSSTWTYRTGRFIHRHRGAVALAAMFALALTGFLVEMAILAKRASREQDIARQQSEFLAEMLHAATPEASRGHPVTTRELLDRGAQRIENQPSMDPEVRASLLENIAESYRSLGLWDEAMPLAQKAYDLKAKLYGTDDPQIATSTEQLAVLHRNKAEYKLAEPLFWKLLSIRRKAPGPNNTQLEAALAGLGECLYQEEKDPVAEGLLREGLAIDRQHETVVGAGLRNYLALLLERRGDYPEAAGLLREAVEIDRRLEGADSPDYAVALHNYASALIDAGDMAGAEAKLRETLEIRRKVLGNTHPDLIYTLNNLAFVLLEKGQPADAEPFATEALAIAIQQVGPKHPLTSSPMNNLARVLQQKGDYDAGEKQFQRALGIVWKDGDPPNMRAAAIIQNLGRLEFDRGHYPAAEKLARQALQMQRQRGGEQTPAAASVLIDLAEDRLFQKDAAAAEPLLHEALDIRNQKYTSGHPAVIGAEVRLAEVIMAEGRTKEAETMLRAAREAARSAPFPLLPWQVAEVDNALGSCFKIEGREADAQALLTQSGPGLPMNPRPAFRRSMFERLALVKR